MRGRIQPHSASGRGTSRHQLWRVGVHVTAGRTRHIGHRPKFTSGSSSGEGTSPRGMGSPHRAQSTSTYHLPDMGKSPRAQSLYAGRDCGATAPCAVPNRSVPRTIRRSAISTTCFGNILEIEPNHLQTDTGRGGRDQWLGTMECRDTPTGTIALPFGRY